jgi:hypothetical protein
MHVGEHLQVHFLLAWRSEGSPHLKLDKGVALDLRSWICYHARAGKMP